MALTLPTIPPARPVDAELTAVLEPGTGSDLADPRRPLRAVLRGRFVQVEALRTVVAALVAAATAPPTTLVVVDVAPGDPLPERPDAPAVLWRSEQDPLAALKATTADLWVQK